MPPKPPRPGKPGRSRPARPSKPPTASAPATVFGAVAKPPATPVVAAAVMVANFCCGCGVRLNPNGTCRNPPCVFVGKIPNCNPP